MATVISGTSGITTARVDSTAGVGGIPAFSVYKSAAQSLTIGANTIVTFDTKEYDPLNLFSANRFTPTVAGYYHISATLGLGGAPATTVIGALYKNGAEYKRFMQINVSTVYALNSGSALVYMNGTTDYLEIRASVSGTAPAIVDGGVLLSGFQGFLARAA